MANIPLVPLAPIYGRSQRNIPLAPVGFAGTPTSAPPAQRDRVNNKAQMGQYENDAFNKWFGGLHPDEAAKFAPATPQAGRLSSISSTPGHFDASSTEGLIKGVTVGTNKSTAPGGPSSYIQKNAAPGQYQTFAESTPAENAAVAHQQQLAAARAHFRANVLPMDQGYRALQAQANPTQGLVPLDPRVQAAQIAADARTGAAKIAADQKPGVIERNLNALGGGIKQLGETWMKETGATARANIAAQGKTDSAQIAADGKAAGAGNKPPTATKLTPAQQAESKKYWMDYGSYIAGQKQAAHEQVPFTGKEPEMPEFMKPPKAGATGPLSHGDQFGQGMGSSGTAGTGVGSGGGAANVSPATSTQPAGAAPATPPAAAQQAPAIPGTIPHVPGTTYEHGRVGYDENNRAMTYDADGKKWNYADTGSQETAFPQSAGRFN